jgi:hypothetical protein
MFAAHRSVIVGAVRRRPLACQWRRAARAKSQAASLLVQPVALLYGQAAVRFPAKFFSHAASSGLSYLPRQMNQSNPALNRTAQKRRFALLLGSRLALRSTRIKQKPR